MELHVKSAHLAGYTIKILANEKVFNPKMDQELVRRIKACALDIHTKLMSANTINAGTNPINREMRYRLQEEALLLCNNMLAYIAVAKQVFHLRDKRIKYWGNMITEIQALIQAWKESDVKRYGQPQRFS